MGNGVRDNRERSRFELEEEGEVASRTIGGTMPP
jgi:hypothetical protein